MPENLCGSVIRDLRLSKQRTGVKKFNIFKPEFHVTIILINCIPTSR
jgi:hypothetical protein